MLKHITLKPRLKNIRSRLSLGMSQAILFSSLSGPISDSLLCLNQSINWLLYPFHPGYVLHRCRNTHSICIRRSWAVRELRSQITTRMWQSRFQFCFLSILEMKASSKNKSSKRAKIELEDGLSLGDKTTKSGSRSKPRAKLSLLPSLPLDILYEVCYKLFLYKWSQYSFRSLATFLLLIFFI